MSATAQDYSANAPQCSVDSGRTFDTATPEQEGVNPARLADVLNFAASRNRNSVLIFRRGCLIGQGPTDDQADGVPWNLWSATKGFVSLLTGIAWDRGKLELDAPIGAYLPAGFGDPAHRSITVRDLLTETSGLTLSSAMEVATSFVEADTDIGAQALGLPLVSPPGSTFGYSGHAIDLLSVVIESAVGEPLQQFAQRELFEPLGIERSDYYWARDRSGHTYGATNLLVPPADFAKIGLLVAHDGMWGDRRIISGDYLRQARTPSPTNSCYGFLLWVAPGCADLPTFLPPDAYAIAGMAQQDLFMVPSLDLMVEWTGNGGSTQDQELPWEFFRRLYAAFDEPPSRDPGNYVESVDQAANANGILAGAFDLAVIGGALGIGPDAYPGCNELACLGHTLQPPFADAPPGCVVTMCIGDDPRTPGIR